MKVPSTYSLHFPHDEDGREENTFVCCFVYIKKETTTNAASKLKVFTIVISCPPIRYIFQKKTLVHFIFCKCLKIFRLEKRESEKDRAPLRPIDIDAPSEFEFFSKWIVVNRAKKRKRQEEIMTLLHLSLWKKSVISVRKTSRRFVRVLFGFDSDDEGRKDQ